MYPKEKLKPAKSKLSRKISRLGIKKSEIVERFVRSRGRGGQKVNKTSTCVYLKHLPSGIEVKCSRERSQSLNRLLARSILAEKLAAKISREKETARQAREKLKRQKRRRSKQAKERILEGKRRHSRKKEFRRSKHIL